MPGPKTHNLNQLLMQFGILIGPLRMLLDDPDYKRRMHHVESQFNSDLQEFDGRAHAFAVEGEFGSSTLWQSTRNTLYAITAVFKCLNQNRPIAKCKSVLEESVNTALKSLGEFPCEAPTVILPTHSPFTSFLMLSQYFRTAQSRLDLFDPYLDKDHFILYLEDVPKTCQITVITDHPRMTKKTQDRDRIVAISDLLFRERPNTYRLLVAPSIHDRYLRYDNNILHLGGSINHAARNDPYTISRLETQKSHIDLDNLIAASTEWCGPNVTPHRTV